MKQTWTRPQTCPTAWHLKEVAEPQGLDVGQWLAVQRAGLFHREKWDETAVEKRRELKGKRSSLTELSPQSGLLSQKVSSQYASFGPILKSEGKLHGDWVCTVARRLNRRYINHANCWRMLLFMNSTWM